MATAWAGHSCTFLCSSQRRQIQISCQFSQVIQAGHIVNSDLKTHLPKCQEKFILELSSYVVYNMYNSFRHKLNSFRQRFIHLLTSHVTSGHLRSQHCSRQGILCSMTSFCIQLIVSQIATESLSALVKETELLRIRQTVKSKFLPFSRSFDHVNALRSCVCKSSTKGSGRGAFPKHDRGGFSAKMFFAKRFIFLSTDLWHRATYPTFCETASPRIDQVFACILYII